MSGHTPGPWSIRPDSGVEIFGPDGQWIMTIYRTREELLANARLIAAAPELLDELRGWYHYARGTKLAITGASSVFNGCLEQTRALLAKIDGGES
jgi:hypothetical protein